jgi:hypothetical protein
MSEKIDVVKQWIEKADHDLPSPFSALRSFRPIRAYIHYQNSTADGGRRRSVYPG